MASTSPSRPSSSTSNIIVAGPSTHGRARRNNSDRASSPIPTSQSDVPRSRHRTRTVRPTPQNTFRHKVQNEFSDAFNKGGYAALLGQIEQAEHHWSPAQQSSRIIGGEFHREGLITLASIDQARLVALLDNTYTFKASQGHFDSEHQEPIVFDNTASEDEDPGWRFDPGHYVNYLAPADGTGLTPSEFDHVLDAIEVGLGIDKTKTMKFRRGEKNLGVRLGEAWDFLTGEDYANVQHPLLEKKDALKTAEVTFVRIWRDILADLPENVEVIPIPPEVGWTNYFPPRLQSHRNLKSSPWFFRFMQCLLVAEFPEKRFQLHQFVIFRAAQASHAALGEVLLTHLCASYNTCGGFNRAQAGIATTSVLDTKESQWREVRNRLQESGVVAICKQNLQQDEDFHTKTIEEHGDAFELRKVQAKIVHTRADRDDVEIRVRAKYTRQDDHVNEAQSSLEVLDAKNNELLVLRQEEEVAVEIMNSLETNVAELYDAWGSVETHSEI